jgi:hypothetical protein
MTKIRNETALKLQEEQAEATGKEFVFYQKLGEYSEQGRKVAKKVLQKQYREMISKRVNWSPINIKKLKEKIATSLTPEELGELI